MQKTEYLKDNLKKLLKKHDDLTLSELARITKIPQPTLHHLLTGVTKKPRRSVLEQLASFFGISIAQLIGNEPLSQPILNEFSKQRLNISTIPLLEWHDLKNWIFANKADIKKEIVLDRSLSHQSFALIMNDSGLEPLIPLNALLIFDREKIPKDREFAIVYFEKTNQILFNRIFTEDSESYIKQSKNSEKMQFIKISPSTDKILGTLIELRLQFT